MRLALFTEVFLPKVDGMVQVVCLLLDHLAEQGIETLIITPRYGDITSYRGFRVINLPSVPFPLYPEARMALPTPSMWREFHAFQPDIVHFVHPFISGVPSLAWVKRHKYPTLISFHLDYARLSKHYHLGLLKGFGISQLVGSLILRITALHHQSIFRARCSHWVSRESAGGNGEWIHRSFILTTEATPCATDSAMGK